MIVMIDGRYRGIALEKLPPGYLRRIGNSRHPQSAVCRDEMRRRGMPVYGVEVTAHAVDRASLRLPAIFLKHRTSGEGLSSWLGRIAEEALKTVKPDGKYYIRVPYIEVIWAFDLRFEVPVLMSVWLPSEVEENNVEN